VTKFFAQEQVDIFLNTTADYNSGKIFLAFRSKKTPVDSYDVSLFWITQYRGFISSLFIKKGLPLGCIAKYPLSIASWSVDKLIRRNQRRGQLRHEVQDCITFDGRFDVFWEDLRRRHRDRLLCVRNKEYLNWHFNYAISKKELLIFTFEEKKQIISYAIFIREDVPAVGLKRLRLVDYQTLCDNSDILAKMISLGIKRCQKEGIHMLESIGFNSQKRKTIERLYPYQRKLPSWPFFYRAKDVNLAGKLKDSKAWDPCLFDGDGSL